MRDILDIVLSGSADATPMISLADWWDRHRAIAAVWSAPIDQALAAGAAADRVGYAFASGYQAALRALVSGLDWDHVVALCATEQGGAHPRAIATTLEQLPAGGYRLQGKKKWATLGPLAGTFLVVATTGQDPQGRNRLRVARVPSDRRGVTCRAMPQSGFAPEIPHAEVSFDAVEVSANELLAGDGYDEVLKPFRTIEDCHVHAAIFAHVCGVAAHERWPHHVREELIAHVVTVRGLSRESPKHPAVHVALAGALRAGHRLLEQCEGLWERSKPAVRERWERDRPLFQVAASARTRRIEAAWAKLADGTS